MQELNEVLLPGTVRWRHTSYQGLNLPRLMLKMLDVPLADIATWKCFRASKATSMVSAGDSLGTNLTAGDLRTRSILNYIDESAVDKARLVAETVESSDEDEDGQSG